MMGIIGRYCPIERRGNRGDTEPRRAQGASPCTPRNLLLLMPLNHGSPRGDTACTAGPAHLHADGGHRLPLGMVLADACRAGRQHKSCIKEMGCSTRGRSSRGDASRDAQAGQRKDGTEGVLPLVGRCAPTPATTGSSMHHTFPCNGLELELLVLPRLHQQGKDMLPPHPTPPTPPTSPISYTPI